MLNEVDRRLAEKWKLKWKGHSVQFQFPPSIDSDNRSADWKKITVPWSHPVTIFASPGPRELTIKWTYVVDGIWTVKKISSQVSQVKKYFGSKGAKAEDFVIKGFFGLHGGKENDMSFLCTSCSVKHGETYIIDGSDQPNYNDFYPLKTEISMSLETWVGNASTGSKKADAKAAEAAGENDTGITVKVESLQPDIQDGWF